VKLKLAVNLWERVDGSKAAIKEDVTGGGSEPIVARSIFFQCPTCLLVNRAHKKAFDISKLD